MLRAPWNQGLGPLKKRMTKKMIRTNATRGTAGGRGRWRDLSSVLENVKSLLLPGSTLYRTYNTSSLYSSPFIDKETNTHEHIYTHTFRIGVANINHIVEILCTTVLCCAAPYVPCMLSLPALFLFLLEAFDLRVTSSLGGI